jgi:hypothetical protein
MCGTYYMRSRPKKPIESTPNDSPRYTEVRRKSIRISYRSSAEEIRTDLQWRNSAGTTEDTKTSIIRAVEHLGTLQIDMRKI